jgi:hypothetical protein
VAVSIINCVLVRVAVRSTSTGGEGEEMGVIEEVAWDFEQEWSEWEARSGWGRRGDSGDWGFLDGRWEVLIGDVGSGDVFNNFRRVEVILRPTVLSRDRRE